MKRVFYFLHSPALALATAAFLTVTGRTGTAAETMKATPLRLAYSAITVNQAIPWISYEAGHFKKYGLDVELIHASSITALQALLAGEVSIAQSVTDACVSSNLNGADTLFMGAILDKRFMKGFLEGMKTYLEDENFSINVIQKWTRAKNRDETKEAYALQARHMLKVPRTSIEGVKTVLEGLDRIPAAKTADPHRFIDFTILDELEKEGFFKSLYKN